MIHTLFLAVFSKKWHFRHFGPLRPRLKIPADRLKPFKSFLKAPLLAGAHYPGFKGPQRSFFVSLKKARRFGVCPASTFGP
jgi:hypothetical protein